MAVRVGRAEAGLRDRAGPYGVDIVAGVLVVSVALVEGYEERCLLADEEVATEYHRDQLGEVGVAGGDGAVVHVVTKVRCQPHKVRRVGG